ncbi:hypothetical protein ABZ070_08330 [Streptomyces sp. NPDC006283]|uniref:hypothetical protein n=1 Tax=Streptomyces sp. NPDC006283 TaxID=3156741 RepID=UPI0033A88F55
MDAMVRGGVADEAGEHVQRAGEGVEVPRRSGVSRPDRCLVKIPKAASSGDFPSPGVVTVGY